MRKGSFRKVLFFLGICLFLGVINVSLLEAGEQRHVLSSSKISAKVKKKTKPLQILSKDKFTGNFNKGLLNLDKKMSFKISKKVAKNYVMLEKLIQKGLEKDLTARFIYEYANINYSYIDWGGTYFTIDFTLSYDLKKADLSSVKKRFSGLQKTPVLKSMKAFQKAYLKKFYSFDSMIDLKVSNAFLKDKTVSNLISKASNAPLYLELLDLSSYNFELMEFDSYTIVSITHKFSSSRKELREIVAKYKKIEKLPELQSEEEAEETFLTQFYNLDKKTFGLKLSKTLAKKYDNDVYQFTDSLRRYPRYNDLEEQIYLIRRKIDFGKFLYFEFHVETDLTKDEASAILAKVTPILQTEEDFIKEIIRRAENLDENYHLNVASHVIDLHQEKARTDFWYRLYDSPEFYDIETNSDDSTYNVRDFKDYFRWEKSQKFNISKGDITNLKQFVTSWVAENIRLGMTEEEKVRAINDFMVKEYRYTYGDKGQLFGAQAGEEKLGKYSVYTSFALLEGKGGVCNAKANMFFRLAKEAGLEVLYVTGNVLPDGLHAWNMVKVNGTWYHLDNTWNRGHYEGTSEYEFFNSRDYYLKGDATMRKDHTWDTTKYPAAPSDYQGYVPSAAVGLPILNKVA